MHPPPAVLACGHIGASIKTLRQSKVTQNYPPSWLPGCHEDVLGFDVTMHYVVGMQIFDCFEDLADDERCLGVFQLFILMRFEIGE